MKIIFGIAACVVVGFVAGCGDVIDTKIETAWKERTTWTPTQIANDPLNYYNFCEKKCKEAEIKLKASEIENAQTRGKIKKMADDAKAKARAGEKLLSELKDAYTKADSDGAFPFTINTLPGRRFDKEIAQREIINVHTQVEGKKKIIAWTETAFKKLDANNAKIYEGRITLRQQESEILTARTTFTIDTITEGIAQQLSSIAPLILGVTDGYFEPIDFNVPINLDKFADQQRTEIDVEAFNKIMGF